MFIKFKNQHKNLVGVIDRELELGKIVGSIRENILIWFSDLVEQLDGQTQCIE